MPRPAGKLVQSQSMRKSCREPFGSMRESRATLVTIPISVGLHEATMTMIEAELSFLLEVTEQARRGDSRPNGRPHYATARAGLRTEFEQLADGQDFRQQLLGATGGGHLQVTASPERLAAFVKALRALVTAGHPHRDDVLATVAHIERAIEEAR